MTPEELTEKIEKKFEYVLFARAYFTLVYIGLQELKKKIETGKYINPFGEIIPDWMNENNYLLVPIFYNFKHGIEISIKGICQLISDDVEKGHDLTLLFKRLKSNKKIQSSHLQTLGELISKYHSNEILNKKIQHHFAMEDKMNDVFRYPDNKASVTLEFFHILPKFTLTDLEEIESDLKKVENISYEIGSVFIGQLTDEGKAEIKRLWEAHKSKRDTS